MESDSERDERGHCSDMEGSVGVFGWGDTCGGLDTFEDASYCYVLYVLTNPKRRVQDSNSQYLNLQSEIPIHIDDGLRVKRSYVLALDSDISPRTLSDGTARVTDYISRIYLYPT